MLKAIWAVALALVVAVFASALVLGVSSADAAYDAGNPAKVTIQKTGGTLQLDVRARGGIMSD
jgi:hypothetical protein